MTANIATAKSSVPRACPGHAPEPSAFKSDASTDFATSPDSAAGVRVPKAVGHPEPFPAKLSAGFLPATGGAL